MCKTAASLAFFGGPGEPIGITRSGGREAWFFAKFLNISSGCSDLQGGRAIQVLLLLPNRLKIRSQNLNQVL